MCRVYAGAGRVPGEPDWEGAAHEQVNVRQDEGARVAVVGEAAEKGMQALADRVDVAQAAVLERDEDGQRHAERQLQEEWLMLGESASARRGAGVSVVVCARGTV